MRSVSPPYTATYNDDMYEEEEKAVNKNNMTQLRQIRRSLELPAVDTSHALHGTSPSCLSIVF